MKIIQIYQCKRVQRHKNHELIWKSIVTASAPANVNKKRFQPYISMLFNQSKWSDLKQNPFSWSSLCNWVCCFVVFFLALIIHSSIITEVTKIHFSQLLWCFFPLRSRFVLIMNYALSVCAHVAGHVWPYTFARVLWHSIHFHQNVIPRNFIHFWLIFFCGFCLMHTISSA